MPGEITFQRSRLISNAIDVVAGNMIVGQLHDIIEIIAGAAHMEDVDEPVMSVW